MVPGGHCKAHSRYLRQAHVTQHPNAQDGVLSGEEKRRSGHLLRVQAAANAEGAHAALPRGRQEGRRGQRRQRERGPALLAQHRQLAELCGVRL